ncbi:MAG: ergothioneine biosynthesis protein EgtB [Aulosira sp. ZfuVER01]|nr:ergothioneine biosynthesis protein EgtB [Aulosira sp. ZfuVER01]MDZ8001343.1 ergothioneine biosynthesis protein EgtB [Aulosira sp. DedVER01a]MDZ8051000.1 ergothioneine biosynthesis protein EgtB [Aulosira sp. ZfuCHP01]
MISNLSKSSVREAITLAFVECRTKTLTLFEGMDRMTFCAQPHPDFSPVGWHLGHIAYTESLWLLERSAGLPCLFPQYRQLFAADGLPKAKRVELPDLEEIRYYLDTVRVKVLDSLKVADVEQNERLWRFLIQHESQHCEIMSMVLELVKVSRLNNKSLRTDRENQPAPDNLEEMIEIPAGEFAQGSNSIDALDNESPIYKVYLNTYYLDRYPVTCRQYRAFMEAGGYQDSSYWSEAGWNWLQTEQVTQPLYWQDDFSWDNHPVCGVSWYEAEAYARFVGKRLPTEAEWEKAASQNVEAKAVIENCNCDRLIGKTTPVDAYPGGQSIYGLYDTLGNVWEWTASWFAGYQGFQSYPYIGYSQVYFDQKHRVLKGGSWATRPWVLRPSFRNWYYPSVRQVFTGFRCAADNR